MKKEHTNKKKTIAVRVSTRHSPDKKAIEDAISVALFEPLSREEKGAAYVTLASAYLDVACSVLERQKAELERMLADFKEVGDAEREFGEKVRMAEVRAELNG
jgi:hypothetical protein